MVTREGAVTIEERLQALEDQQAILRVLHLYGHTIDYDLEAPFVDLWTDDALVTYNFDVPNALAPTGLQNFELRGRDQLRAFFRSHTHAPAVYHKHFLVAPAVQIDGNRATAESYYARLDEAAGGGPVLSSFGRYRDVLVRCPDGRWRLQERHASTESRVPRR